MVNNLITQPPVSTPNPAINLATITTWDFQVDISSGSLAGKTYSGSLSYDASFVKGVGREKLGIDQGLKISFDWFSTTFTEKDDFHFPSLVNVRVRDGNVLSLDWLVSRGSEAFSFSPFANTSRFTYQSQSLGTGLGSVTYSKQVELENTPPTGNENTPPTENETIPPIGNETIPPIGNETIPPIGNEEPVPNEPQPEDQSPLPTSTLSGSGDQKLFVVSKDDGTKAIADFGGVGIGTHPSSAIINEVDTLKFESAGLTADQMLLTQVGSDLVITFADVDETNIVLKNFQLENLDNLPNIGSRFGRLGNIIFDGQNQVTDSFDIFNADQNSARIWNRNTVTFLNDLDNVTKGFDRSDDVINGQGGNDTLMGLSGNDILRGGMGNDTLMGGVGSDRLVGDAGDDLLIGGAGNDTLVGGSGSDIFGVSAGHGLDMILDFTSGEDILGLSNGLTFNDLSITQGTDSQASDTSIAIQGSGEVLAVLTGIQANTLTSANFTTL